MTKMEHCPEQRAGSQPIEISCSGPSKTLTDRAFAVRLNILTIRGVRQFIRVDRVNYDNEAPWPTGPDGGGTSLKRKVTTDYGNDVANWEAASPTPGL